MKDLPLSLTTREAMKIFRVSSYQGLNAILSKYNIRPAWRGGKGNVYRGADLLSVLKPDMDKKGDPFYEHVDG